MAGCYDARLLGIGKSAYYYQLKTKKMKKLKLQALNFRAQEILTRDQLKTIVGGETGSTKYKCCWNNFPDSCSSCVEVSSNYTCVAGSSAVVC